MAERKEIALIYNKSKNWIAGAYYIQNLISALLYIDDTNKPLINVYCKSHNDFQELCNITNYPYLKENIFSDKNSIITRIINKIHRTFNPYYYKPYNSIKIKNTKNLFIYPISNRNLFESCSKLLVWIPDFQEKYYPHYFSKNEIKQRNINYISYCKNRIPIVFSSNDALEDFKKFYNYTNSKTFVLPFAVTLPDFSSENIDSIKKKYNINTNYFFCANQFWEHKNHLFLFKVFNEFIKKGYNFQLICSGALKDYRNNLYSNKIKSFIRENKLEEHIKILGFIDRTEQLCLMKNSYAIIQPSLFEGWSTVVEDAKALNKFIFLSNLKVHIEQSPLNVCYFDPKNSEDLVNKLIHVLPTEYEYNYQTNIKTFADNFIKIIDYFHSINFYDK